MGAGIMGTGGVTTDLLLIHPGNQGGIYGPLAETLTAIEPPTWTRMIAGWLRDRGHKIAIIDQEAERLSPAEVARRAEELDPRLVAIVVSGHQPSASTQQMTGARAVARALSPGMTVVMLGNHPSALPERTLGEENVDLVCDGEGPLTLAAILRGDAVDDIPGLFWRHVDGRVRRNPLAPLIPIDELHGDVWDLLPMERYRAHNWQCFDGSLRQPYASIYTTLGCPFRCGFCMINVFQHAHTYRRRDPARVVEQIDRLYREHGVRTLKFADEMFVLDDRHVRAICGGLAAKSYAEELNIWAYARIDTVKPRTLDLLRRAGIRWLALGIESGSALVRDGADKSFTNADIKATVRAIQAAGVNVIGNFIFGLPDDTLESMQATLALAKELNCEFANFYCAMAYPGSTLHDQAVANGWRLPASWSGYSQHSRDCTPLPTETLSSAEVLRFRDAAFNSYFNDPAYRNMIGEKFGLEARLEIQRMTARHLKRDLLEAA